MVLKIFSSTILQENSIIICARASIKQEFPNAMSLITVLLHSLPDPQDSEVNNTPAAHHAGGRGGGQQSFGPIFRSQYT